MIFLISNLLLFLAIAKLKTSVEREAPSGSFRIVFADLIYRCMICEFLCVKDLDALELTNKVNLKHVKEFFWAAVNLYPNKKILPQTDWIKVNKSPALYSYVLLWRNNLVRKQVALYPRISYGHICLPKETLFSERACGIGIELECSKRKMMMTGNGSSLLSGFGVSSKGLVPGHQYTIVVDFAMSHPHHRNQFGITRPHPPNYSKLHSQVKFDPILTRQAIILRHGEIVQS